ncbi:MAG: YhjD/YihY/BrkB family envelope integrity protein [bacterium]
MASGLRQRAAGAVRRSAKLLQRYPRLLRLVVYLGRLSVQLWRKLIRDECLDRAASLAYTTVLALVPLLAVSFLVFRLSGDPTGAEAAVRAYLFESLLANSVGQAVGYLNAFLDRVSAGAVGVTGTALLVFTATWLFITVEGTLNHIFHVREQRRLWARFTTFWSLLTFGPVLIAVGIYFTAKLDASAAGRFLRSTWVLGSVLRAVVPVLMSALVLSLMYKLVPNRKVRLWPAVVGGLVGGLLFEISKGAFNLYVTQIYSGSYTTKVYGTFALFPVFLLWIYIAWLVVLFGAVVAFTVQHLDVLYDEDLLRRVPEEKESAALGPYAACRLLLEVSHRHHAGKTPPSQLELERALRMPEHVVYEAIGRLVQGKLLTALDRDDEAAYVPARDLGDISLDDALRAYHEPELGPSKGRVRAASAALDDLFCDLALRQREVAGEITFLELLEAVPAARFEAHHSSESSQRGPEVELKTPPEPLPASTKKSVDPDAG